MQALLRWLVDRALADSIAGDLEEQCRRRATRGYLYEVTPYDPRVWAAAIVVIVATTAVGTWIPSWKASKTDPVKALRAE